MPSRKNLTKACDLITVFTAQKITKTRTKHRVLRKRPGRQCDAARRRL